MSSQLRIDDDGKHSPVNLLEVSFYLGSLIRSLLLSLSLTFSIDDEKYRRIEPIQRDSSRKSNGASSTAHRRLIDSGLCDGEATHTKAINKFCYKTN